MNMAISWIEFIVGSVRNISEKAKYSVIILHLDCGVRENARRCPS